MSQSQRISRAPGLARAGLAAILALGLLAPAHAEDRYTVTELGKLWARGVTAMGVNAGGQVAGTLEGGILPVKDHAFVSTDGEMRDLHEAVLQSGRCRGMMVHTSGRYVTDQGEVVGWLSCGVGEITSGIADNWFVYRDGVARVSPGTVGGSSKPGEYPVSLHGVVHIFKRQEDGTIRDAGLLAGRSAPDGVPGFAMGMNPAGQVVGWAADGRGGSPRAWVWKDGSLTWLPSTGPASKALGVNAAGEVVGAAQLSGRLRHAFLYRDGSMTDLGTLGGEESVAEGINTKGQIVGWSEAEPTAVGKSSTPNRAFIYEEGHMKDLTRHLAGELAPYVTLREAVAINDAGLILANGSDSRSGAERAYLLTPVKEAP